MRGEESVGKDLWWGKAAYVSSYAKGRKMIRTVTKRWIEKKMIFARDVKKGATLWGC